MLMKIALVLAWPSLVFSQSSTCQSFGIDFQDGGSYFQNALSNSPFTFVETFEGCQNDTAQNILVDPSGNEYQCTDTPMMPANVSELSTCPLNKTQLTTGEWSLVIISNNGNGDPIAYQRDFSITVGTQATATATPTITANLTSTPILNVTQWVTQMNYTTLPAQTFVTPSVTITPTYTVNPKPVTATAWKTLTTIHMTIPVVTATTVMKTIMATCTVPRRQQSCDKSARYSPTLAQNVPWLSSWAAAAATATNAHPMPPMPTMPTMPTMPAGGRGNNGPNFGSGNYGSPNSPNFGSVSNSGSGNRGSSGSSGSNGNRNFNFNGRYSAGWKRDAENERRYAEAREEFVARRHERLVERNLHKRAPDVATVTVTDSNSADWKTTTQTWIIPTQTLTVTSTTYLSGTFTPSAVALISGQTRAAVVTEIAPESTKTVQKATIAYSLTTKVQVYTMTLTTTVTPSGAMKACKTMGGWFGSHRG